jgi:hypothetical protein
MDHTIQFLSFSTRIQPRRVKALYEGSWTACSPFRFNSGQRDMKLSGVHSRSVHMSVLHLTALRFSLPASGLLVDNELERHLEGSGRVLIGILFGNLP